MFFDAYSTTILRNNLYFYYKVPLLSVILLVMIIRNNFLKKTILLQYFFIFTLTLNSPNLNHIKYCCSVSGIRNINICNHHWKCIINIMFFIVKPISDNASKNAIVLNCIEIAVISCLRIIIKGISSCNKLSQEDYSALYTYIPTFKKIFFLVWKMCYSTLVYWKWI